MVYDSWMEMKRLLSLFLLVPFGCSESTTSTIGATDGDSSPQDSSSGQESDSSGSSGQESTSSAGGSSSGESTGKPDLPTPTCPPHPYHKCTVPVPCSRYDCGEENSPFQEDGCMRPACQTLEDCDEGFYCKSWNSTLAGYACSEVDRGGYSVCACGGDPIDGNFSLDLCFPKSW